MRCVTKTATLRSLMTLRFVSFSFLVLKTTPVTVGEVSRVMSFDSLGLSPDILRAVAQQGYRANPPLIQQQAIPAVLEGRDLMASAHRHRQNSGLYAAAVATPDHSPAARQRASSVRALILTPTRELAAQIGENVQ